VLSAALLALPEGTLAGIMPGLAVLVQPVPIAPVLHLAAQIALRVGIKALLAILTVTLVRPVNIRLLVPVAAPTARLVILTQALQWLRAHLVRQAVIVLAPLLAMLFLPDTTKVVRAATTISFAPVALTALVAPELLFHALLAHLVQQDLAELPLVLVVHILLPVVLALLVLLDIILALVLLHAQYVARVAIPIERADQLRVSLALLVIIALVALPRLQLIPPEVLVPLAQALSALALPELMRLPEVQFACLLLLATFLWQDLVHIQLVVLELMLVQVLQYAVLVPRVRIRTLLAHLPHAFQHLQAAILRPVHHRAQVVLLAVFLPLDPVHALLVLLVLSPPVLEHRMFVLQSLLAIFQPVLPAAIQHALLDILLLLVLLHAMFVESARMQMRPVQLLHAPSVPLVDMVAKSAPLPVLSAP
jgi:hypothetical protein